ncbi:hypothetical protein, partial [[Eubacterium] cellulosolvens]
MSARSNQIREYIQRASLGDDKSTRYLFLSQIIDKKVQTKKGITVGKLKDLAISDDRHYAEVTSLVVE